MGFEEAVTAIGGIAPGAMDAFGRLFPGVPLGSADRAKSRSIKRMMRDIDTVKRRGADLGLTPENTDALCTAIVKERIGSERFANVVGFARELEPDTSRANEVEPSWAEAFRLHAEGAVDEEAQRAWAAILAGEMERPGSISKRAMRILGDMSKKEAEVFQGFCRFSVDAIQDGEWSDTVPVLNLDPDGRTCNNGALPIQDLGTLESIGLIAGTVFNSVEIPALGEVQFQCSSQSVFARNPRNETVPIVFQLGSLSPCGKELASICERGKDPSLVTLLMSNLMRRGLRVRLNGEDEWQQSEEAR